MTDRSGPWPARGWIGPLAGLVLLALMGAHAATAQTDRPRARPNTLSVATMQAARSAAAERNAEEDDASPAIVPPIRPTDVQPVSAPGTPVIGPETNLPLPRYVSLKVAEANVRRGPSLSHRIDWVFLRRDMPLQVVAEYGHWRRVIDREGLGGWVHYSLLSGSRSVIVDEDMLPIRAQPDAAAPVVAQLQVGVVARLNECEAAWCRIAAGGYAGWAPKSALWGVEADEVRD